MKKQKSKERWKYFQDFVDMVAIHLVLASVLSLMTAGILLFMGLYEESILFTYIAAFCGIPGLILLLGMGEKE